MKRIVQAVLSPVVLSFFSSRKIDCYKKQPSLCKNDRLGFLMAVYGIITSGIRVHRYRNLRCLGG